VSFLRPFDSDVQGIGALFKENRVVVGIARQNKRRASQAAASSYFDPLVVIFWPRIKLCTAAF
jgi:hypothetical protein